MIQQRIKELAFGVGLNLTKQSSAAAVRGLVRTLRPMDCGRELIRVGGDSDGGYLIPNDLEGVQYCFSPGVSITADFESELADRGITSFMADYSVDGPPVDRPEFVFDKKFLGANNSEITITLETWRDKYVPSSPAGRLLQMDIEGSEYEVILSAPRELLRSFRIIVVEFHFLEKLFDPFVFTIFRACFEKLLADFHVAHIHPNNSLGSVQKHGVEVPRILEMTFYNKDRVHAPRPRRDFPHPLDRANTGDKAPLPLPGSWYE